MGNVVPQSPLLLACGEGLNHSDHTRLRVPSVVVADEKATTFLLFSLKGTFMAITLRFETATLLVNGSPVADGAEVVLGQAGTTIAGVGLPEMTDIAIVSNFLAGRLSINGENVL